MIPEMSTPLRLLARTLRSPLGLPLLGRHFRDLSIPITVLDVLRRELVLEGEAGKTTHGSGEEVGSLLLVGSHTSLLRRRLLVIVHVT